MINFLTYLKKLDINEINEKNVEEAILSIK
jgi:hypothetical protein